jgi:hypothetical protein
MRTSHLRGSFKVIVEAHSPVPEETSRAINPAMLEIAFVLYRKIILGTCVAFNVEFLTSSSQSLFTLISEVEKYPSINEKKVMRQSLDSSYTPKCLFF